MDKKYGFVYVTTNLINGKKYIGRRKINSKGTEHYLGSGKAFKRALKKYGKESFKREILEYANSEEELKNLEEYYITLADAHRDKGFYNIVKYSDIRNLKEILSEEEYEHYRKKLSEGVRKSYDKNPNLRLSRSKTSIRRINAIKNRNMSEEEYIKWKAEEKRIRISKIRVKNIWKNNVHPMLGKHHTEETKAKLSKSLKNIFNTPEKNPMFGKSHSEQAKEKMSFYAKNCRDNSVYRTKEYIEKMSKITKGKNNGMYGKSGENAVNGKKVFMLDDYGNIVKEFTTIKCALEFLKIKNHVSLNKACKNSTKYRGYYWSKESNYNGSTTIENIT